MQSVTNLCLSFPALGTPSRAAIEYSLFHTDFVRTVLTPNNRFLLDIGCLSEHNIREKARREEEEKEREQRKKMPGVTRMVSASERSVQLKRMKEERKED
jgi:hypothetical protein